MAAKDRCYCICKLKVCLNVVLSARRPVCMSACTHVCMSTCLHVRMSTWLHVDLSACTHVDMSACRPIYVSSCVHAVRSACLHVDLSTCLSAVLRLVWYLIVSIPDLCTLTYFDYQSSFACAAWRPLKVSHHFHLMLLFFQSSELCVQSPSIIPVPGYPLCLVPHLRSLDDRFSYPVV